MMSYMISYTRFAPQNSESSGWKLQFRPTSIFRGFLCVRPRDKKAYILSPKTKLRGELNEIVIVRRQ